MIAVRSLSPMFILSVSKIKKKPIRNDPGMFIKNAGNGNLSKILLNGETFVK